MLSARLPFLDDRNARRRDIAEPVPRARGALHGDPRTTVAHHAVALARRPADARRACAPTCDERGIMTAVHYPWLVSEMPGLAVDGGPGQVAADRRDRILSHALLPRDDRRRGAIRGSGEALA